MAKRASRWAGRETAGWKAVRSRYYIRSLKTSAGKMLAVVRQHWSVEKSLHRTFDMSFREGQDRVQKDHAPKNLATSHQISHNPLK